MFQWSKNLYHNFAHNSLIPAGPQFWTGSYLII